MPMAPAPITISSLGSSGNIIASVLVIIFFLSTGIVGTDFGDAPVAIIILPALMVSVFLPSSLKISS